MKNKIYFSKIVLVLLLFQFSLNAQEARCKQKVIKSTNINCSASLVPSEIDDGSTDYDFLTVSESNFNTTGFYLITLTAGKNSGGTSTCVTKLTIVDSLAPIILCPANITTSTNPWVCGQNVSYDEPDVFDNCGTTFLQKIQGPNSGALFPEGITTLSYQVFDNDGNSSSCSFTVEVLDKAAPIAIGKESIVVRPDYSGSITLIPEMLDNGSYDHCSAIQAMTVTPSVISCQMPSPVKVILRVYDEAGNYNEVATDVYLSNKPNGSSSLACNDQINIYINESLSRTITPDMILEGTGYKCWTEYDLTLTYDSVIEPNTVDASDVGKNYLAQVKDIETGSTCWGNLRVYGDECQYRFYICDKVSRCFPFSGCEGEHSPYDNIEWPCDVDLSVDNVTFNEPTPENLTTAANLSLVQLKPEVINYPLCNHILVFSVDEVENTGNDRKRILREWTVFDANENKAYKYIQKILLSNTNAIGCNVICDTQPWNTPVTTCEDGHSTEDAVEWPADIWVESQLLSPYDLALNPNVDYRNVKPVLREECTNYFSNYSDEVIRIADTVVMKRTWTLTHKFNPAATYQYVQTITTISTAIDENMRTVCVTLPDGRHLDSVLLQHQNLLEGQSCKTFEFNSNDSKVKPTVISDDVTEAVDMEDLVILYEHLLGISPIENEFQLIAADLNLDGSITAFDALLLLKIIKNDAATIQQIDNPWRIYFLHDDENLITDSVDIAFPYRGYNFVAVKLGDINHSFGSTTTSTLTALVGVQDQLLNKGETYTIPFQMMIPLNAKGIELNVSKNSGFDITGVNSEIFQDLILTEHDDHYTITGLVPQIYIQGGGYYIDDEKTIIELDILSKENNVLNQTLKLDNEDRSKIQAGTESEIYEIELNWDGLIPVKTKELSLQSTILVFPNPAQNEIFIQASIPEKMTYELSDLSGRKLATGSFDPLVRNSLDVGTIQNGLYLLRLNADNGRQTVEKILIQH